MAAKWLQLGDRLILDDADYAAIEVAVARMDRGSVQAVRVAPELGGDPLWLLQVEDEDPLQAEETDPASLGEEQFQVRWAGEARTESAGADERTQFGRGECELYQAESGAAAFRMTDQRGVVAFVGRPLEPGRIDLRFT